MGIQARVWCRLIGFFLTASLIVTFQHVQADTLTEQLASESPETLVRDAREAGNIVRGAILFHQGKINCAKCHQNSSNEQDIAPNLRSLGAEVSVTSLVESILEPSKSISKGYETTKVLTVDGKVLTGLLVSKNEAGVIIRDQQDVNQLRQIRVEEIEEISASKTSIMPAGLADELSSRQQFLDLLRYVIDLKERGPIEKTPQSQGMASGEAMATRRLSAEMSGLVLIRDLNCNSCHRAENVDALPAQHLGPDLKWSANRLNPAYLAKFIAEPHQTKPGTNMPELFGKLDANAKASAAESIVHFLVSISGNEFEDSSADPDTGDTENGRQIFHSVGCVACHSPRDANANEQELDGSVPMGDLSAKYDSRSLVEFLENPQVARPHGRMPSLQLSHREAIDLSTYLLAGSNQNQQRVAKKFVVAADLASQGKKLFQQYNCSACHEGVLESPSANNNIPELAMLNLNRGCLSSTSGSWPNFELSDQEIGQIRSAITSNKSNLNAQDEIDFTLASYRCTSCHSRNQLGGVSDLRQVHFQTTNLNLGEQGRIPPTLTGVGSKLKKKWMRDVLVNGRAIRPYMKTRMPQYGESHVGHLVDLFESVDQLPATQFVEIADPREARKAGLQIVGNRGLNCAACHTFQYKLSDTMPAVDLTEMAQRLKKDWFYQYMLDPQKFSPNTVMPSYWPGGKALRADIAGTPEEQIESVWQYLLEGRQARPPAGVIREPLEIVVTDKARILRRKYPQIGKRGIGVGYPGGVNLAYDAQQMRLATIWRGRFADPAAAWYGQGSGDVRAMGPSIQFAKGPELFDPGLPIVLDDARPTSHQFKGYSLDEKHRPTMRYELGPVVVSDFFREFRDNETGQMQLRRTVSISSSEETKQLRFRIAAGDAITQVSSSTYNIGKGLTIKIVSGRVPEFDGESLLYLPLLVQPNQTEAIVLEYIWK